MFILRLLNRFYSIGCSFFCPLEVIFSRLKVRLPRLREKRSFSSFETGFTAFAVLFLAIWRLFWVNWRYFCQDTGENINSWDFKPTLRRSCSIFSNLEVTFIQLKVSLPRHERKHSFTGFLSGFTTFAVLFLSPWSLFWVNQRYCSKNTAENFHFPALKAGLQHCLFYF